MRACAIRKTRPELISGADFPFPVPGTFSRLMATFDLERLYGFYILQIYVPTILIVILAWVSFWVNMDAVPARISLGVTTVLTMATQLSGSKTEIPKVHYPKAIDVWMTMCMMFVFVAMVEYTFVNALSRDSPRKEKEDEKRKACDNNAKIAVCKCWGVLTNGA